jgi:hypothetical protein
MNNSYSLELKSPVSVGKVKYMNYITSLYKTLNGNNCYIQGKTDMQ